MEGIDEQFYLTIIFLLKCNFPFLKRYSFLDRQGIVTPHEFSREDKHSFNSLQFCDIPPFLLMQKYTGNIELPPVF
jgi:hypothetical protein